MNSARVLTTCVSACTLALATSAQVNLVEPGHRLVKHVDSVAPLDPSQVLLETLAPGASVESIAVDPGSGDLFVQLQGQPLACPGATTYVFRITPGAPFSVNPCPLPLAGTGFGICERGADMHWDPQTGWLLTQDMNSPPFLGTERIAWVDCNTGATGTYSPVTAPIFGSGTFGMDFSFGLGDVPPGDVVFTGDVGGGGLHSAFNGGAGSFTHVAPASLPGGGDDMVIQPDGDWVWVGDFANGIIAFSPFPPHLGWASPLNMAGIFSQAGLPFTNGTRATVCRKTGNLFVSISGGVGGTGLFRIDEPLRTATLILTIGRTSGTEGLQDLTIGPSTTGVGESVFFTVHDQATGGEQVWEVTTLPGCCPPFAASETPRLGAPPNPNAFLPGVTGPPIVGTVWRPIVAPFLPGAFIDFAMVDTRPGINAPTPFGTLLCNVPPPNQIFFSPPGTPFSIPIPLDCSLVGLPVCSQGGEAAPGILVRLANALDLFLGTY